ncbi:hypothetical protein NLG97_g2076 [Lecanicillium saksenae]|uniref:Uncharacterized protein n=1 Tax=Lecanicillium saksenae TaxID=468837 RepID=A0ACC1R4K2_9HYPO|nr:hypothetical protein NLG97_g2076 [Lecanicillium saksenae]
MATLSASKWPLWLLALPSFYFIPRLDNLSPLSILSALSAAASPFAFYYFIHEPTYVRWSLLLWTKLAIAGCLIVVQAMPLLQNGQLQAMAAVVSAVLMGMLVYAEHKHSIRPSSAVALLLIVDILSDIDRNSLTRLVFEQGWGGAHGAAPLVLKFTMIVLQSMPKEHLITDEQLQQRMREHPDDPSFQGLSSALLNPLAAGIYSPRAFMRSSSQLHRDLHPELLLQQLKRGWAIQQLPEPGRPGNLLVACLKTWSHILWPLMITRLALTALKCAHPFVLLSIIRSVETRYNCTHDGFQCYTAFASGVAVFVATAIVQEHYTHLMTCFCGRLRGGLIALQFDKLQRLTEADAKKFTYSSLISSDIDGIIDNMPSFLVIPVSLIELGLGVEQLTAIKMLGLGPTVCQFLQGLRIAEIQISKPLGVLSAFISIFNLIADLGAPAAAIRAAISADLFTQGIAAAKVFPLLSIITSTHLSFPHIINSLSTMMSLVPCFERIQEFLCLPERKDCRVSARALTGIGQTPDTEDIICFNRADLLPYKTAGVLLREVDFELARGSITGLVSPHGAGKSTFLRAILGNCEVSAGSVQVNEVDIGYCGEEVSLREGTIRENIIGDFPYDAERYSVVVRACFLEDDLTRLPGGDEYMMSAHGFNLSDGQRQRIGIARTIYPQHKIILLDDVFRLLDIQTAICILHQLCGRNSILRQWGCTVVVATSLPDCLKVTDQLILLDGHGHASLDRICRTPAYRQRTVNALRTLNINNNALLVVEKRQQQILYRYLEANGFPVTDQSCDERSLSNWKLLKFAIRPIGTCRALLHACLVLVFSAVKVLPNVYLCYWIEFHANDLSLYPRYASVALAAASISFMVYFRTTVSLSARISVGLHRLLVQTLGQTTLDYFGRAHMGNLLKLFHEDTSTISKDLPRAVLKIMHAGFETLIMIAIIVSHNIRTAMSFPVIILMIILFINMFCSSSRLERQIDLQKRTALCTFFEETSAGLACLDPASRQKRYLKEGMNILADAQISFYNNSFMLKMLRLSTDLLSSGLVALLVVPAVLMKDASTVTSVALSYHTAVSLSRVLHETILAFTRLDTSLDAVQRLVEFEQQAPQETTESLVDLPPNWPSAGEIEILNLSAYHSPAVGAPPALSDISMFMAPRRHVGIMGRSCSGKSSLILMLLGFIRYKGLSRIDGIEISSIAPDILREHLITITREPVIFEGTVRQNLLPFTMNEKAKQWRYAEDEQKDAELEHLLKRLHIWIPLLAKGGLDAILDQVSYSKGDLQLLCIARAIIRQRETGRKVILIDDATHELDLKKEELANDIMAECFAGCTVVRTCSRTSALGSSEGIAHLHRGRHILDPNEINEDSGSDGEAQE